MHLIPGDETPGPVLAGLGLSGVEEDVYQHLVDRGEATPDTRGAALAHPPEVLAESLAGLVRHGLVTRTSDEPRRYVVGPPSVTLGSLLAARRDELHRIELAITELAEHHRAAAEGDMSGFIEIVTGAEPIRRRFLQVMESADHEIRGFTRTPSVAVHPRDNPAELVVAGRGLRNRVVMERSYLADPGSASDIDQALRRGQEVAVVAQLPVSMVIADSAVAMVPLLVEIPDLPRAVLTSSSGLLSLLVAHFENTWAEASPLRLRTEESDPAAHPDKASGPARLTALDAKILDLLLAGLTDRAVAGALGVSLRTVTRRIRHLMDLAGADNRIQLGWRATQRGWL
ncbi:helix-turn-helix domain-containing protein [Streptomyces mirabilis]|uniref:helix-turn-helix domain-containing protein n=1 Tax=Streptomyces mirabilis TaxID=68239 RepID=UPI00332D0E6E